MNEVSALIPGGKTALESLLKANLADANVQAFLGEVKKNFHENQEFKNELERTGLEVPVETNSAVKTNQVYLDGLNDQEKARVLNALQDASSSNVSRFAGANLQDAVGASQHKQTDNTKWLIALGVAAIVAIVMFRGIVFRTLYFLACKLPIIGKALKAKFGEPKEIISGKLSESTRKTLVAEIKELSDLLGISGYKNGESRLARCITLMRKLNPDDIQEVMDAAKDYQIIR